MLDQQSEAAQKVEVLRVGDKTNPRALAGAIATVVREKGRVVLQTIGAGSLNQAYKAIAIARGFMAPSGVDLIARPSFKDIPDSSKPHGVVTAIATLVEPK